MTEDNYKKALETLVQRYATLRNANTQLLISTHIDQLFSKFTRSEKLDKIESNVRNLKIFNVDPEQHRPVFVSIIMSKLPNEICFIDNRAFSERIRVT